ncbi:MAG: hypothetical protein A2W93_09815 [Bacteroidetes bacterium GWF2_43_63]|nr:MAG: hypothetical protein A2W94_00100 [Bacteroidetes bacterium GWE2_42_42]OFY56151.1 MAG: hypothetical protein A2W93_09815 [Bacteroidetes bacterium GWF2_43_63]HBG69755.1 DUF1697 domain-containing protein [Bacteroidales bacterium]HCB61131.1 DUF1697 domain-containing protein [Bacteroidales bacterium]HCY24073.1 DUF1697 domain-containing protein [Bacteroidales bacterium]
MKTRYVALLRGINVGGKNVIPMKDLKSLFEQCDFSDVETYIQSGNVMFSCEISDVAKIKKEITINLKKYMGTDIPLVLLSAEQLRNVVTNAPLWFGAEPALFKYDVAFLDPEINAETLLPKISLKEGVDCAAAGHGVLYFSKLIEKESQSRLPKIIALPEYRMMTIRNRNTTLKLSELV